MNRNICYNKICEVKECCLTIAKRNINNWKAITQVLGKCLWQMWWGWLLAEVAFGLVFAVRSCHLPALCRPHNPALVLPSDHPVLALAFLLCSCWAFGYRSAQWRSILTVVLAVCGCAPFVFHWLVDCGPYCCHLVF